MHCESDDLMMAIEEFIPRLPRVVLVDHNAIPGLIALVRAYGKARFDEGRIFAADELAEAARDLSVGCPEE